MPTFEERGLPGPKRLILVVEDNDIMRMMLVELLGEEYEIVEATNGQEGVDELRQRYEELSLVLLDVYMPVLDGFGFLRFRQTEERYANIPVIVATSSDTVEDEITCLELGANDVIVKPYNADVLLNRVRNTIRLRESASIINQLRWDHTTGLYRSEFFYRRTEMLLAAYPDMSFDLICCDIRNFKALNERYGRESCDQLLADLAAKLGTSIPRVVASGRIGGDAFAFLTEHQEGEWTYVLNDVVGSLGMAHLYVRFGVISGVDHLATGSQLCDRAMLALEELKDSVGAGIAFYDDKLRRRQSMERELLEGISEGLTRRQFVVYYQTKHDLRTGKICGAEALVRWLHPTLGFVRPEIFVPLFERNGMIAQLDAYVREEVCAELWRIKRRGLNVVPISVNISPLDFDDHSLAQRIVDSVKRCDLDPSLLHLELTETAYADDPDHVVSALTELRSLGFKVELDDFGSGHSSLSLLTLLPLDVVKIDGEMVRRATRRGDFRVIRSAIEVARLLGLETVAEGVETKEAVDQLKKIGCDCIQGFYFSWPLRQGDFEECLVNG